MIGIIKQQACVVKFVLYNLSQLPLSYLLVSIRVFDDPVIVMREESSKSKAVLDQ